VFGNRESLVGTMTEPASVQFAGQMTGVVLLNAGLVHRVGPNRLYVKLARRMAALGHPVLRFDFSGTGDSGVRRDHRPLEECLVSESQEAMDWLEKTQGVHEFILMGLCSGAVNAVNTACVDPRVTGAVLINARPRTPDLHAKVQGRSAIRKYWKLARTRPLTCLKALATKTSFSVLRNVAKAVPLSLRRRDNGQLAAQAESDLLARQWASLAARGVQLLLVYSEWDPGLDYLEVIPKDQREALFSRDEVCRQIILQTNHTFTQVPKQDELLDVVEHWVLGRWTSEVRGRGVLK
jgi:pimeloyl-ACP methyl ester carboxylesterase